ncbi:hypothetical protein [Streptacidiphilus anmyonensis]|uniref:hypothetical protein n=1 Tax=Streptacidiphilus anmyonensis TaxID=405782 RepID=UPI00191BE998
MALLLGMAEPAVVVEALVPAGEVEEAVVPELLHPEEQAATAAIPTASVMARFMTDLLALGKRWRQPPTRRRRVAEPRYARMPAPLPGAISPTPDLHAYG